MWFDTYRVELYELRRSITPEVDPVIIDALPDLESIRQAERRIRGRLPETPTLTAPDLAEELGHPLWLKAENLQRTGSFKPRGVLNWLATAASAELDAGLVTVSAGNHALALAWAASTAGIPVTVVMPAGSSPVKIAATRAFGAEVRVGGTIREAVSLCRQLAGERGLTLVHPYNDPRVMAGQGTVGLELLRQLPDVEVVLCPIGGGGLISGIGIAAKALKPSLKLIGVEPEGAATMRNAWDRADPGASLDRVDTIAASLAPVVVGEYTYAASRGVVDDIVLVSDEAIRQATRLTVSRTRLYVETGAVLGAAALLEGKVDLNDAVTAAIVTGGNMDPEQMAEIFQAAHS